MRISLWILLFFPSWLSSQIKFLSSTTSLVPTDHFSGSVVGIADMNADGLDDIIRLQNSRILSIAYQTAPGKPFIIRNIDQIAAYEFWNVVIGDINQDGWNDMVFGANENPGYVYYSLPSGDSVIYQKQALLGSEKAYAQAGNLVDINNDGWLDFFLCNDIGENKIWANSGGRLRNNPVSWIDFSTVPVSDMSGNYSSLWSDLDGDRDLDLYIAKCKGAAREPTDPRRINVYYRNDGKGVFKEAGVEAGIALSDQSWSAIAGDSDNDGDQDLFVINHFAPSRLMINDGKGKFTEVTATSGINYGAVGVQCAWVDLDNDGWLDLIISGSQHQIYLNKKQNKFELIDPKEFGIYSIESLAIGDLNHDGRQDLYASYSLLFNESSHRPDAVWLNQTNNGHHFIDVRLAGVGSNLSAVGAKIIVYTQGMKQIREIFSGSSYGIQHTLTQHFGLGTATKVDSVTILWSSGVTETIQSPFIDRTLVVTENQCFGFDPVLTPSPNKTVLCTAGDSLTLTAPTTGEYLWSTGATTRSITIRSAGNYQVKIKAINGCNLYSNNISVDFNPISKFTIAAADSVICQGGQTTLALLTERPLIWNTGSSSNQININTGGRYFATIQDHCKSIQSDTATLRVIAVPALQVKNDTVPLSGKAALKAQGQSVFWFAEKTGGNALASGNTYNTLPLNMSTTYYAQSIITTAGKVFNGGLKNFAGASKFNSPNFSGKLLFDVNKDCILKSVKVYADTAALREINLLDAGGNILASKLMRIEKGESRVVLNFNIPQGLSYALAANEDAAIKVFGSKSPKLYRTEGTVPYPLVAGPLTIYGTNAGPGNYYYFYDWEMAYPDLICTGDRVAVQGVVKTVAINDKLNESLRVYPNPIKERLTVEWDISLAGKYADLELLDTQGRQMYKIKGQPNGNKLIINDLSLNAGIYYLRVKIKDKSGIYKVVVVE